MFDYFLLLMNMEVVVDVVCVCDLIFYKVMRLICVSIGSGFFKMF